MELLSYCGHNIPFPIYIITILFSHFKFKFVLEYFSKLNCNIVIKMKTNQWLILYPNFFLMCHRKQPGWEAHASYTSLNLCVPVSSSEEWRPHQQHTSEPVVGKEPSQVCVNLCCHEMINPNSYSSWNHTQHTTPKRRGKEQPCRSRLLPHTEELAISTSCKCAIWLWPELLLR